MARPALPLSKLVAYNHMFIPCDNQFVNVFCKVATFFERCITYYHLAGRGYHLKYRRLHTVRRNEIFLAQKGNFDQVLCLSRE